MNTHNDNNNTNTTKGIDMKDLKPLTVTLEEKTVRRICENFNRSMEIANIRNLNIECQNHKREKLDNNREYDYLTINNIPNPEQRNKTKPNT